VVSLATFAILLITSFSSIQVNQYGLDYSAISKKVKYLEDIRKTVYGRYLLHWGGTLIHKIPKNGADY
jgi:hypothetical protein